MYKQAFSRAVYSVMIGMVMLLSPPVLAEESSLPTEPQDKSPATESVQAGVDQKSADRTAEKRKQIISEAKTALAQTRAALKALDEKNVDAALASLEKATGKLELILAREPDLALAPVDVNVITYDLLARPETVKAMLHDAEDYLEDGQIQQARPLIANMASEIVYQTTSIPLITYPTAIKAVSRMIDQGKLDEARAALKAALNTLIETRDVIPLPVLRAELMLERAESLAENEERTTRDNETLDDLLKEARTQLNLAELLGYGDSEAFEPMFKQLDHIEEKTADGKGGKGWFDKIKQQISQIF
jgi:predicted negative regulator of RcsB-dependent stress response